MAHRGEEVERTPFPWAGVGWCCLGAGAFYLLGRSGVRDADFLRSVLRVASIADLADILDTASIVMPLVVTLSGRVGSDTPISCKLRGLRAVIVKEEAKQFYLVKKKQRNGTEKLDEDYALLLSVRKEVPWYLEDNTGRANIIGAHGATGLVLKFISKEFVGPRLTHVCGKNDCPNGLEMLNLRRTEEVLPTGTSLTVVGEAIKDAAGTIRIQRPQRGPFYVSPESIDKIIAGLEGSAWCCHFVSMGFAVFGVCLLANHILNLFLERNRWREWRKREAEREVFKDRARNLRSRRPWTNGRADEVDNSNICVICLEQEYNAIFVPCGHMCCCTACSSSLTECPLCWRRIDRAARTFLP